MSHLRARDDVEEVEFRVAELLLLYKTGNASPMPFDFLESLFVNYDSVLKKWNMERDKENSRYKFIFYSVGRHPRKTVFLYQVVRSSYHGGRLWLGRIGHIQSDRLPEVINTLNLTEKPLPLSPYEALIDLAHFAAFEYNGNTYIIYEMNSDAPLIQRFTEYLTEMALRLLGNKMSRIRRIASSFVRKDPISILARYRFITSLSLSFKARGAQVASHIVGRDLLDALFSRRAKRVALELSGEGEPITMTISELLEILEHSDLSGFTRFVVRVKKWVGDKALSINVLQNYLSFIEEIPLTRVNGRVGRNLDTNAAFDVLKKLVDKAVDHLEASETEEGRTRPAPANLLQWMKY